MTRIQLYPDIPPLDTPAFDDWTLRLDYCARGMFRVSYWRRDGCIAYQTMLAETPEEAQRFARLTIDSFDTLPEPLRTFAPIIDQRVAEVFGGEA